MIHHLYSETIYPTCHMDQNKEGWFIYDTQTALWKEVSDLEFASTMSLNITGFSRGLVFENEACEKKWKDYVGQQNKIKNCVNAVRNEFAAIIKQSSYKLFNAAEFEISVPGKQVVNFETLQTRPRTISDLFLTETQAKWPVDTLNARRKELFDEYRRRITEPDAYMWIQHEEKKGMAFMERGNWTPEDYLAEICPDVKKAFDLMFPSHCAIDGRSQWNEACIFMLSCMSMSLGNDKRHRHILFLFSAIGMSGKTGTTDWLCRILGEGFSCALNIRTLVTSKNQGESNHDQELLAMLHKRFVTQQELADGTGKMIKLGTLKTISSKDKISARACHGKTNVEIPIIAQMTFTLNKKLDCQNDVNLKSRIQVVPFNTHFYRQNSLGSHRPPWFKKEDPSTHIDGVEPNGDNWVYQDKKVIDVFEKWQKDSQWLDQGLLLLGLLYARVCAIWRAGHDVVPPRQLQTFIDEYLDSSDPIDLFIKDDYKVIDEKEVSSLNITKFTAYYNSWAKKHSSPELNVDSMKEKLALKKLLKSDMFHVLLKYDKRFSEPIDIASSLAMLPYKDADAMRIYLRLDCNQIICGKCSAPVISEPYYHGCNACKLKWKIQ